MHNIYKVYNLCIDSIYSFVLKYNCIFVYFSKLCGRRENNGWNTNHFKEVYEDQNTEQAVNSVFSCGAYPDCHYPFLLLPCAADLIINKPLRYPCQPRVIEEMDNGAVY